MKWCARPRVRIKRFSRSPPEASAGFEEIATWYSAARGAFPVEPPRHLALAIFLADHGVVVEGGERVRLADDGGDGVQRDGGGAAASVLARRRGVDLLAVDVGIVGDTSAAPVDPCVPLIRAPVRRGTGNLRVEEAMTGDEARAAMDVGTRVADEAYARGVRLAAVGEIGIGNTTSAAALVSVFAGAPPEETCGRGTGIDDRTRARKIAVVRDALRLHVPRRDNPLGALAAVGGLEIAAMVGFLLRSAALRCPWCSTGSSQCCGARGAGT